MHVFGEFPYRRIRNLSATFPTLPIQEQSILQRFTNIGTYVSGIANSICISINETSIGIYISLSINWRVKKVACNVRVVTLQRLFRSVPTDAYRYARHRKHLINTDAKDDLQNRVTYFCRSVLLGAIKVLQCESVVTMLHLMNQVASSANATEIMRSSIQFIVLLRICGP